MSYPLAKTQSYAILLPMLYTGYTKLELDTLMHFLDSIDVPYQVHMDEDGVVKARQRGADAMILRIEIEDDVLIGIDPKHYPTLEPYRIYPQFVEPPAELFQEPTPENKLKVETKKPSPVMKALYGAIVLALVAMYALKAFH